MKSTTSSVRGLWYIAETLVNVSGKKVNQSVNRSGLPPVRFDSISNVHKKLSCTIYRCLLIIKNWLTFFSRHKSVVVRTVSFVVGVVVVVDVVVDVDVVVVVVAGGGFPYKR